MICTFMKLSVNGRKRYSEDKENYVKTPTHILRYSPVVLINSIIKRYELS